MASNLHVKIDRMAGRGVDKSAFYGIHLQNALACNGRGMDLLLCLSYEDVEALRDACRHIVDRCTDHVYEVADQPGTSDRFEELPEEDISSLSREKKFIEKEGAV